MSDTQDPVETASPKPAAQCQVCASAQGRYKCPACQTLTCSLTCTKQHKQQASCTGQRSRTSYIPRGQFNDASINNDYNFLTSVERDLDNAARAAHEDNQKGRPPHVVRQFVQRAKELGEVDVVLAPRGLKRSRTNCSHWHGKRKCLIWTVEWVVEGEPERLVSERVAETQTLQEAFGRLRSDGPESMHYLLEAPVRGAESAWTVLDPGMTIQQALRHREVQEFPTFQVFRSIPEGLQLEAHRMDNQAPEPDANPVRELSSSAPSVIAQTDQKLMQPKLDADADKLEEGELKEDPPRGSVLPSPAVSAVASLPMVDFDKLDAFVPYT